MTTEEKIKRLREFKERLDTYDERPDPKLREWLNQNVRWVRREVIEAGAFITLTFTPPPAVGGLIMRDVDPFSMMFERVYFQKLTPHITDMIDKTVGVLLEPPEEKEPEGRVAAEPVRPNYAFVAMAIDRDDHQLVDVLEAIKEAASKCGVTAERVDEVESNDRITDRILESIANAEFVIVDLTHERPNVFFEAGYAQGKGKIPIYIARSGTRIHFDIKDYPIIEFRNMKELKEGLVRRLQALAESTPARPQ